MLRLVPQVIYNAGNKGDVHHGDPELQKCYFYSADVIDALQELSVVEGVVLVNVTVLKQLIAVLLNLFVLERAKSIILISHQGDSFTLSLSQADSMRLVMGV